MILGRGNNPIVIDSKMPIYWLKKVAKEVASIYPNVKVVKVSISNKQ